MSTGEFINLKCTWITHDINWLWINDNYLQIKPAHTEIICPTTDSLTRSQLYGIFVINNSK